MDQHGHLFASQEYLYAAEKAGAQGTAGLREASTQEIERLGKKNGAQVLSKHELEVLAGTPRRARRAVLAELRKKQKRSRKQR